jgi:hypothetical protein
VYKEDKELKVLKMPQAHKEDKELKVLKELQG